jgi:hypothetical protein
MCVYIYILRLCSCVYGFSLSIRQFSLTVHDAPNIEKAFTGEPTRLGSFKNQKPLVSIIYVSYGYTFI